MLNSGVSGNEAGCLSFGHSCLVIAVALRQAGVAGGWLDIFELTAMLTCFLGMC